VVLRAAVPAVALAAVATFVVWPTTSGSYAGTALAVAEQALAQVRTVRLMVDADAGGQILPPYRSTLLWQARESLATAQDDLATQDVPDAGSAALHDELQALLSDAGAEIAAAGTGEGAGSRALAARLGVTGDRLARFLERHR
jgi:hypothetical protein